MRAVATRIAISAQPEIIWQVLTNATGYPDWNTTVSRVDGKIAAGEQITIRRICRLSQRTF